MFRHVLLASVAIQAAWAGAVLAQSSPGFVGSSGGNSSPLTAAALNSAFTAKQNTLPTITGDGTLNTGTGALTVSKIGGVSVNLGGAFSTSGAYTTTLTTTGNTSLTLPLSGTLATQAYVTGQGFLTTVAPGTITQGGATAGQALEWSGSAWAPANTVNSLTAGTGLNGGTITTAGTLSVAYGTAAGTAAQGNDSRLLTADGSTITNAGGTISVGSVPSTKVTGLPTVFSVVQPVATRTGTNGEQGLTAVSVPSTMSRTVHILPYGGSNLQMVYPAFQVSLTGEVNLAQGGGLGLLTVQTATVAGGGSGYAAGDFVVLNKGTADTVAGVLQVDAVSSGAVTKLSVVQPGAYVAMQADGAGQASTTGSGTGLTVNFQWGSASEVYHVDVEPTWGTQSVLVQASQGSNYKTTNYDLIQQNGQVLVTDPVPVVIPAGAAIGVRTFTQGRPMALSRYGVTVNGSQTIGTTGNPAVDTANSGTMSGSQWQVVQPYAILGHLSAPQTWVLLIGDSIACGVENTLSPPYDPGDSNGNIGWVERGIASRYPVVNTCRSSDGLYRWYSTQTHSQRMDAMRHLGDMSHCVVFIEMGVNDFFVGHETAAQEEALMINLFTEVQSLGVQEIYIITPTPETNSTDGWAVTANQTVAGSTWSTNRLAYNALVRSGAVATAAAAAGITIPIKVFDVSALVEQGGSSSPTGLWNLNGTAGAVTVDGVHMSTATDVTVAASFPSLP